MIVGFFAEWYRSPFLTHTMIAPKPWRLLASASSFSGLGSRARAADAPAARRIRTLRLLYCLTRRRGNFWWRTWRKGLARSRRRGQDVDVSARRIIKTGGRNQRPSFLKDRPLVLVLSEQFPGWRRRNCRRNKTVSFGFDYAALMLNLSA